MTEKTPKKVSKDHLTPEQRARQTQGIRDYWKRPPEERASTGANIPRLPKNLNTINTSLKELLPDAIKNIGKVVSGDPTVDKQQSDMSKWIVTMVISNEKAALENRTRKLELLAKEKQAKADGLIADKTAKEQAEEFGKPKLVNNLDFGYKDEWDEGGSSYDD